MRVVKELISMRKTKPCAWCGFIMDITDREDTEEEFICSVCMTYPNKREMLKDRAKELGIKEKESPHTKEKETKVKEKRLIPDYYKW